MKVAMSPRNVKVAVCMILFGGILLGGGYALGYFNGKTSIQTPDEAAVAKLKAERDVLDKKIAEAEKTAGQRLAHDVKAAVIGTAEKAKEGVTGQPAPKPDDSASPLANGQAKPGPGNPGLFN